MLFEQERPLVIETPDEKLIHGRYFQGDPEMPYVIFVHAFGGSFESSLIKDNTQAFAAEGFSTYRLNLYDDDDSNERHENARLLSETTLAIQADDLHTVSEYLQEEQAAQRRYVVAHSFGALAVVLAGALFDRTVLLDPSHKDQDILKDLIYNPQTNAYYNQANELMCSEAMKQHYDQLSMEILLQQLTTPTLVISAGDGILTGTNELYHQQAPGVKRLATVPDADHSFSHPTHRKQQIDHAIQWLRT